MTYPAWDIPKWMMAEDARIGRMQRTLGLSFASPDWPLCQWFALCDNKAEGYVPHPILGDVPTCGLCVAKLDLRWADR